MNLFDAAKIAYEESGVFGAITRGIPFLYRHFIRSFVPTVGYVRYAGIPINRKIKIGDSKLSRRWLPYPVDDLPGYEDALVSALKKYVKEDEMVVVIGGGMGVTTVIAARQVGEKGTVICFEGTSGRVRDIKRAVRMNHVSDRVEIKHAIVGRATSLAGPSGKAQVIHPETLPKCDVLELDCEGAEVGILKEMKIRPRVILVETHGSYGSPTEEVRRILQGMSYEIVREEVAEKHAEEYCREHDIFVLVAVD